MKISYRQKNSSGGNARGDFMEALLTPVANIFYCCVHKGEQQRSAARHTHLTAYKYMWPACVAMASFRRCPKSAETHIFFRKPLQWRPQNDILRRKKNIARCGTEGIESSDGSDSRDGPLSLQSPTCGSDNLTYKAHPPSESRENQHKE